MDPYRRVLYTYKAERNITQKDLAELLGVAPITVGRWLTGQSPISPGYYDRIEKLTGFRIHDNHCPVENMCPVWDSENVNHKTASLFEIFSSLDDKKQLRLIRYAHKLLKESN